MKDNMFYAYEPPLPHTHMYTIYSVIVIIVRGHLIKSKTIYFARLAHSYYGIYFY